MDRNNLSWIGRLNIVKMPIFPNRYIGLKWFLSNAQQDFFYIGELLQKFIYKVKGTRIAKTILISKKMREIPLHNFKSYYKTIVIKTLRMVNG